MLVAALIFQKISNNSDSANKRKFFTKTFCDNLRYQFYFFCPGGLIALSSKNWEELNSNTFVEEFQVYEKNNKLRKKLELVLSWIKNIKPTSTDSERVFSVAGNVKTKIKNLLQDDTLNALVFLKHWFKNHK